MSFVDGKCLMGFTGGKSTCWPFCAHRERWAVNLKISENLTYKPSKIHYRNFGYNVHVSDIFKFVCTLFLGKIWHFHKIEEQTLQYRPQEFFVAEFVFSRLQNQGKILWYLYNSWNLKNFIRKKTCTGLFVTVLGV